MVLFFWIAPNVPTRGDLVLETGLLCWGLLCVVESGRRVRAYVVPFTMLAVFATASVALVGCDLAVRGRWRLAVAMAGGFGTCFVLGWMSSGQARS